MPHMVGFPSLITKPVDSQEFVCQLRPSPEHCSHFSEVIRIPAALQDFSAKQIWRCFACPETLELCPHFPKEKGRNCYLLLLVANYGDISTFKRKQFRPIHYIFIFPFSYLPPLHSMYSAEATSSFRNMVLFFCLYFYLQMQAKKKSSNSKITTFHR